MCLIARALRANRNLINVVAISFLLNEARKAGAVFFLGRFKASENVIAILFRKELDSKGNKP